jgi:hypothetical protein
MGELGVSVTDIATKGVTAAQRAQIDRELRGEDKPLLPLPDGWVTALQATGMLGYKCMYNRTTLAGLPSQKAPRGSSPHRRPTLYRRADIERVAHIAELTGLKVTQAVRVVVAEIEGRICVRTNGERQ